MPVGLLQTERHRLGLILILGAALTAAHVLWLPRILVDDAFISFRYSRNLVAGHGLVFNLGQRVEGYSNFLWVILTAFAYLWRLDPGSWCRALGGLSLVGSIMMAVYLGRRLIGSNRAAAAIAIMLASSTALCGSAMGGLETGLYTLLVTTAVTCASLDRLRTASVFLGLAALTRPEGAAVCVICAGIVYLTRHRDRVRTELASIILPCALMVGVLLAFRLIYYGQWMPNSVRAKGAMLQLLGSAKLTQWPGLVFNEQGICYVRDFIQYTFGSVVIFAALPSLFAVERRRAASMLLAVAALGAVVAVYNFGDWMSCYRLLTPYLPILTVLVVWGIFEALLWVRARRAPYWRRPAALVAGFLVVYCSFGQFQRGRPPAAANPDLDIALALTASRQPNLLAATDVLGRLGYYAQNVPILDMAGLTDAHIAANGTPVPPFGKNDFDYVLASRPHLIMNNVRSAWFRRLDEERFTDGYVWVDRPAWTRPGGPAPRPRFVFIRRGSVLEEEMRKRYPNARFRDPADLPTAS